MMNLSPRGIVALASHEGLVPGPYLDSVGVWTYGIGHTAKAGNPDPVRMPRGMPENLTAAIRAAVILFATDVQKYAAEVRAAVKVPVEQHEFDALVSFHYNTGGIRGAQLTKALNANDRKAAADGFMGWLKPREILERRTAEQRLFRDGVYPSGRLTVWRVNSSGRVLWTPARTLDADELLALLPSTDPLQAWLATAPAPVDAIRAWLDAMPEGASL